MNLPAYDMVVDILFELISLSLKGRKDFCADFGPFLLEVIIVSKPRTSFDVQMTKGQFMQFL